VLLHHKCLSFTTQKKDKAKERDNLFEHFVNRCFHKGYIYPSHLELDFCVKINHHYILRTPMSKNPTIENALSYTRMSCSALKLYSFIFLSNSLNRVWRPHVCRYLLFWLSLIHIAIFWTRTTAPSSFFRHRQRTSRHHCCVPPAWPTLVWEHTNPRHPPPQ
jgi:hypothetical protein